MMPQESSVSGQSSITIVEASFTLIYDVYMTGVTNVECQVMPQIDDTS